MILVIGSVNADLVSFAPRFPEPGETISGTSFSIYQGGKGANQAVAAAKAGANVKFFGAVGEDTFGDFLVRALRSSKVDITNIMKVNDGSGVASIWVDSRGENSIILNAGANAHLTDELMEKSHDIFRNVSHVLLQLETPLSGVVKAAQIAKGFGAKVVLDPAPARSLPNELIENIDYITPNETELSTLAEGDTVLSKIKWLESHRTKVIVKAGANGVYFVENDELRHLKAFKVKAVDTTGAGDCFNASFTVALSNGLDFTMACEFAMAASAISVTRKGAGSSFPTKKEIDDFLKGRDIFET